LKLSEPVLSGGSVALLKLKLILIEYVNVRDCRVLTSDNINLYNLNVRIKCKCYLTPEVLSGCVFHVIFRKYSEIIFKVVSLDISLEENSNNTSVWNSK
jgi:hypothetical protein